MANLGFAFVIVFPKQVLCPLPSHRKTRVAGHAGWAASLAEKEVICEMDKMEVKFVAGSEAPKPVQYNRLPGALVTSRTVGPFALRKHFARGALLFAQRLAPR